LGERRRRQIEEAVASYNPDWCFRKVDRRNREEIRRLADKGDKTQNEIAALFGISRTTVSLIKNRFGRYAD
jgi:DNA invertase Pin-like site-specific DNA recombinase